MIYQVRANLFFKEKDDAKDFVDLVQDFMDKALVIHPDESNQEGCTVELIMCFHDETPTKPCISCGTIQCP